MANSKDIAKSKSREALGMIPYQEVETKIAVIRGQRMMLDFDVADLYGVETKRINEAVRNNPEKFPQGYFVELTSEESAVLRSKISTLETGKVLTDIVMPDLQTSETESTLELNFIIGRSTSGRLFPLVGSQEAEAYSEAGAERTNPITPRLKHKYHPWIKNRETI